MPARGSGQPRKYLFVDASGKEHTRWRIRETVDGHPKPIVSYGKTKSDAQRKHKVTLTHIADGIAVGRAVPRFAGLVDQALTNAPRRWALNTRKSYHSLLHNHAVPAWGNRAIASITAADVADLLRAVNKTYADGTMKTLRVPLQYVFDYARNLRWIRENPARGLLLDPVGRTVRTPQALTLDQCRSLAAAARADRDPRAPVVVSLLLLGLRNSEACGLRWDDLTLAGPVPQLRIAGQLARAPAGGWQHTAVTKTSTSRRAIALGADLARRLAWYHQEHTALRDATGTPRPPAAADFVLRRADGRICTAERLRTLIERLGAAIGVMELTPHWFRHTAATLAQQAGAPIDTVAAGLGHANSKITDTVYTHNAPPPSLLGVVLEAFLHDDRGSR